VLRLFGIAISIGLADSLNPSTIAPALYLAAGDRPRESVTKFTLGVFAVYFVGGALIAIGPGELLLDLIPKPTHLVKQLLEVIAGVVMLAVGSLLWRHRTHLGQLDPPAPRADGRSSALLGAGITAVELPTAFPYFAAIAAIVGSGQALANQVIVLVVFNVCFVLPLVAIVITLWMFGDGAALKLTHARDALQRHWPVVLAVVAVAAGAIVITLGVTGIGARVHGRLGRFFRHFHRFLPH
jgi:cytochrome c biogenesis protein CcdA